MERWLPLTNLSAFRAQLEASEIAIELERKLETIRCLEQQVILFLSEESGQNSGVSDVFRMQLIVMFWDLLGNKD